MADTGITGTACNIDDNITVHGDLLMWDLDDIYDDDGVDNLSNHLAPNMVTTPTTNQHLMDTKVIGVSSATSGLSAGLAPDSKEGTTPRRHISSPLGTRETFKFRELLPNQDMKPEMTNQFGKTDLGDALIIDEDITIYGDVMMLDLESKGEGHSINRYAADEKFDQLTENQMPPAKPAKKSSTATGIRHLMAISRNPELSELPKDGAIKTEKDVACELESKILEEEGRGVKSPMKEGSDIRVNKAKKPADFCKMVRCQIGFFGNYIQKKLLCH